MSKAQLYEYAIIWHPTKKQQEEQETKAKLIVEPTTILAKDENSVLMTASMSIPVEYKDKLEQVDIVIRPF